MQRMFTCPDAAREHLESLLWPAGPVCPRCQGQDAVKLAGKSTRPGVYKCRPCRKPFTVTVGTVFHASHIPLHKWLYAAHLMASSKKGVSAHQIHRTIGVTYKAAWHLAHRLREAMRAVDTAQIGGVDRVVEADSAQLGKRTAKRPQLIALQERGGEIRTRLSHNVNLSDVTAAYNQHLKQGTELHTDEANAMRSHTARIAKHRRVNHSLGYVLDGVHTNSVEGFFSVIKRGLRGVYQHWDAAHTGRYVDEFAFRHNRRTALGWNDGERAGAMVCGAAGKRLTYGTLVGKRVSSEA